MLDRHQLIGHVALPLPLVSLVPAPGALTNVTLVRVRFDYTGLRALELTLCGVSTVRPSGGELARPLCTRESFPLGGGESVVPPFGGFF